MNSPHSAPANVSLHIEHLVLDGFPFSAADRERFAAAVTDHLGALIAAGDPRRIGGEVPTAVPQVAAPATDPVGFGRQIAEAIYGQVVAG